MTPVVLDFDASVGAIPGATHLPLADWQESIRFGCRRRLLRDLATHIEPALPSDLGTVFMGSGDFHHLTLPLIERLRPSAPFDVVVFDNHPDNMRYAFGVHCGSWVRHVAALPGVRHVQMVGIHSGDVGWRHAWENHLTPLRRGRLSYRCIGVDTGWTRRLGLGDAVLSFDSAPALLDRLASERASAARPVYLSIDKDVFAPSVARTNWDQGVLDEASVNAAIGLLRHGLVGSDITGEVSVYRYRSALKRLLSAVDEQPAVDDGSLAEWQAQQHALNLRLLQRIEAMR